MKKVEQLIAILNKLFDTTLLLTAKILYVYFIYLLMSLFIASVLFVFEAHSIIALYTDDITSFSINTIFQYYLYHSMAMSVYITCGFIIKYSISTAYDRYKEFKCTKNLI